MLKVTMEVTAGNKAISEGSLPEILNTVTEKFKPEAIYFYAHDGNRAFLMVFDMKDASEIPSICEPFFTKFNAKVELIPVMNLEDLQKGLQAVQKS